MLSRLRKYFISGLLVFLPMGLTVYLFFLIIDYTDKILGKYLEPYFYENFGFWFPGVGIIILIYLIVLIGFLVTNFFGRRVHSFFEHVLLKLPFFKQVYPALKQMAIFLFSRDQIKSFRKVVLIEYPRKGIFALGFLTNDSPEKINQPTRKDLCNVFVPSAPGPLTGYVMFIPRNEIIVLDMSVEDAVKIIVSGGVVNP